MAMHIYNAIAIRDEIKRNKNEKNLYEKINDILKGATIKNRDLAKEVTEIIAAESRLAIKKINEDYSFNKEAEEPKAITVLSSNLA